MKLTTLFFALAAVLAGAAITEAATIDHAGPWTQIHHKKDIKSFRIYAEPKGADLRSATPVYDKCTFYGAAAKNHDLEKRKQPSSILEFQDLRHKTVGINCVNCTPQELGNLYQTDLYLNCAVLDHRSAGWKPKGGN
ncbi:hypothetical protein EX895_005862 [Sporisorium graminicola]|uniref:Uncharacterized protein n=1 Tax=Sporisorium graminicola TaxID=280036 RepID=A0A4U7KP95_9BASI|nr:hypothetical protein EX895_005862 [Sporisorium graminicola]TKY84782.1 hypothetical protein EX895_005862 [Sporisorium graminicola]